MNASLAFGLCLLILGCNRETSEKHAVSRQMPLDVATPALFKIIATDSGFDAPAKISAGLRHIVFENQGSQTHESMLVKLPEGMSPDDYVSAVKGGNLFPEDALDYSGSGLTAPGETVDLWLKVDPGHYILICWNYGHSTTDPVHRFTVLEDDLADDIPPREDVVLKLFDFRFELNGTLRKGAQVIRVETPGPSMHEVDIFRLHDAKTVADLTQWRKQKGAELAPGNAAPADAMGGVLDSHDVHRVIWLRRTFSPGRYVLYCGMPMTGSASGAKMDVTHADVGMVKEFEIKP